MDFSKFKTKLSEFKDKAVEFKNKTIETAAKKIWESSIVISRQEDLDDFISKSENKKFISKEWEEKIFIKRSFIILWDSKKDFFKDMLISLPILLTKAFSQSLSIKLIDISNEKIDVSKYEIKEFPAMIVFENKEVYKIISWEENLKKVVKNLSLDINKIIEEL